MTRDARKRQRPEDANQQLVAAESSGSKKSKGRPRVLKQDESAADRRRTQIRLAQRAYRERKENTISNLQEQVASLNATIESLNNEFRTCRQTLLNSDAFVAQPELVQELHASADRFSFFVKASQIVSSASEGDSERESTHEEVRKPPIRSSRAAAGSVATRRADIQLPLGFVQVYDDDSSHLRHAGSASPTEVTSMSSNLHSISTEASSSAAAEANLLLAQHSARRSANKTITVEASIRSSLRVDDPRYVFSSEESTFARRLHRAGLEKAYHLLGRSSALPKLYQKTFQLSLLTDSRDQLIQKAKIALTRSITDPIDFHRMPFFHLGGAGTHYGQDRKTNAYFVKQDQEGGAAKIYSTDDDSDSGTEVELDLADYDTVWFDPADVEGWLASLGVRISPRENFAEIEVPEISPLAELLRNAGRLPPQPQNDPSCVSIEPQQQDPEQSSLLESQTILPPVSMSPSIDLGFGDIGSLGSMNFANDASSWLMGAGDRMPDIMATGWNKYQYTDSWNTDSEPTAGVIRKITLDIGHFLDTAIRGGVCLGRSPGFQRRNVEKALLTSIVEVV